MGGVIERAISFSLTQFFMNFLSTGRVPIGVLELQWNTITLASGLKGSTPTMASLSRRGEPGKLLMDSAFSLHQSSFPAERKQELVSSITARPNDFCARAFHPQTACEHIGIVLQRDDARAVARLRGLSNKFLLLRDGNCQQKWPLVILVNLLQRAAPLTIKLFDLLKAVGTGCKSRFRLAVSPIHIFDFPRWLAIQVFLKAP